MGLIDSQDSTLSISAQCRLLEIPRASFYYRPTGVSAQDLLLLRLLDEQYLVTPFYGSRRMMHSLRLLGFPVGRKRVQRLMQTMGLRAVYPRPKTSRPHPVHKIFPYLLRDISIDHPNQVWAADIERHEALFDRAVVKGHRLRFVAAGRGSWGQPDSGDAG